MVSKDMTIAQVIQLDANTIPIFLEYGMHCLGCPMASAESLEDACASHGIDADALVDKLNDFFASK